MAKPYSQDLRDRVLDAVDKEGMSWRAAAERFGIGESSAPIRWIRRLTEAGLRRPVGTGGHRASKLAPHRAFIEATLAEQSDLTQQSLCDRLLAERGVKADTSMVSRSVRREGITFKKKTLVAREQTRPDVARHRERWRKYQVLVDPARLVFID
jgi:transposase